MENQLAVGSPSQSRALRKQQIVEMSERVAADREDWLRRNSYYHEDDYRYMRFLVPPGQRVLELGCGTGDLLASLSLSEGVGVDISPAMISRARARFPSLRFHVGDMEDTGFLRSLGGPFDVIILSDSIGYLDDVQALFENLLALCTPRTRIVISYYSKLWQPILSFGERLGLKMPQVQQNWLSGADISGLLSLAGFETVRTELRQLVPRRLLGLGDVLNRFAGTLPGIRHFCLRSYLVARPLLGPAQSRPSTTIVIPCRNEAGNIAAAVDRVPRFCDDIEIVFVEGHSSDDTVGAIKRVIADNPHIDIKLVHQTGRGKGDAVREGFARARGDVLMILDADLTMPPEDLPKFYAVLASGRAEFANGTRMIYPMEDGAMRFLNSLGNRAFCRTLSWLINQRLTDTLCGTKAMFRDDYLRLAEGRGYFSEIDPFGDFDLIFGAAKLNLRIVEVPVRYAARTYGTTQIRRFRDGFLLARMVWVAFRRLKAF